MRKRIEDELNEESPLSKMELSVEEEKRKLGQRMMDEKLNGFLPKMASAGQTG